MFSLVFLCIYFFSFFSHDYLLCDYGNPIQFNLIQKTNLRVCLFFVVDRYIVTSLFSLVFPLNSFMFVIQYIMPLCVVISFIYSVAILVQSIVYEKEQRLKEVMKMMGLSNAVHWTAWFITSIVSMLMIVILLTVVLKVRRNLGLLLIIINN